MTADRPAGASVNDQHDARLVLKRELGELDRLGAWVHGIEKEIGLVPDIAFALELCLEEAVVNIIMYGDAESGDIRVTVKRSLRGLVVRIEDHGRSFDPTTMPAPPHPRSLDDASAGNLGIHLIRSFSTGMHYERDSGLNTLTLTFAAAEG